MATVKDSLIKFDPPQLQTSKRKAAKAPPKLDKKGQLPELTDLLAAVVPPREYAQGPETWSQSVSSTPATRLDIVNLQESLDLKLQQRQARESGICPIREELYSQCFDELIRQITINCAERGLLLLRVRDEIRMAISAYQALYESSIAFGMRKALMAEQKKSELRAKVRLLGAEVSELERSVESLTAKCADMEASEKERYALEEERHAAELAKLKSVNDNLKETLDALLAPPSRK